MINKQDIDRFFVELNSSLADEIDETWKKNFTDDAYEFLLDIVPGTLRQLLQSCTTQREVLATFTALWVGGIRMGWELKEQYDTAGNPQETI